ncbi:TetR/AcrR family transcriptional regulator [Enemella evansiae]|uniref:TetR family transcriptional regulator n=1 Tax=Enemella evansiae TaxID=2016499 RepID=A0A255GF20_9ACTN|nr:TetR/AcrR family transcriptional regulator [Enemella evansiae]PFG67618.1 TetR family transcriptional regulator [Propionibacteriaceae bacterium ES.041]OYN98881.1 TetR family transcriptional regulator [Enemella evansiae]OYO01184.1 TetR family transcriptional regulator [Enemella evansiae]OYO05092.1 TetR family transcriptional regulator [Enemella evansiae]OYO07555.1 TetR family transcriptional regulator [Enemella evansiae]
MHDSSGTRPGTGARQRLPREQRRLQLLDVAGAVFAAKGYHSAAMDDIAEAAGVSKPVLYQHFASKLDLYLALVDRACDQLVERVTEALQSTEENRDRVYRTIGAFYDFVSDSGRSFRFVFESDLTGDAQVQERLWRAHQDIAREIGAVIAGDTGLPDEQAELLGMSLVGMAQVSARHWAAEASDDLDVKRAVDLISSLAWRGIRAFPKHNGAEH